MTKTDRRVLISLLLSLCLLVWSIDVSFAAQIKVAAIQYRAVPLDKATNIRALKKMVVQAVQEGARLIVLPEMCTTGLSFKGHHDVKEMAESVPGPTSIEFSRISKRHKVYIAMGMPEFDEKLNKYFNSQIIIGPDGAIIGKYRKIHLFGSDFNWAEKGDLGYQVVETKIGKIGLGICNDINYPDIFEYFRARDVNIFAFSSNWISNRSPFAYWTDILRDKEIYFIAANNWGHDDYHFSSGSIILSPGSLILAETDKYKNQILYAHITIKKKILLTGFGPFGGFLINSSWEAVKDFDGKEVNGYSIKSVLLPVQYKSSARLLLKSIMEFEPDIVISFGLAPDHFIRLERIAKNRVGTYQDNIGEIPETRFISEGAPATFSNGLPLEDISRALSEQGIPAHYSTDAGDYVCNYLFYNLMASNAGIEAGFIHLPPISDSFPIEKIRNAVDIIIQQVTR